MRRLAQPRRFPLLAIAISLTLAACATAGGSDPRADPDVITLDELDAEPGRDLLTTIRSLRPAWLRVRAARTFVGDAAIAVFIDGQREEEGVGTLYQLRASEVRELRRLNAADATTRFGIDMAAGAIVVTLRR